MLNSKECSNIYPGPCIRPNVNDVSVIFKFSFQLPSIDTWSLFPEVALILGVNGVGAEA